MKSVQSNSYKKSKFNSKAISPVVATALLLVVAVVAVVGFQTFFNTYSSGLFSKVETQSTSQVGNTQIENLIGNSLYFKNSNTANITINSVKVDDVDCSYSGNASTGISEINVTSCISNITTSTPEVVIYTNNGIYSKKFHVINIISSNTTQISALNCSALGLAGGTWITVPGNVALGTSDFCVMKYEAKNVGGVATSQASVTPWVNSNLTNVRNNCSFLGNKYHVITNAEWMTIARNVENVSSNWNSSVIGSGFLFLGHSDNGPIFSLNVTNQSDYYDGTNDGISSPGDGIFNNFPSNDARAYMGQKRVLILSNSEIIWDLSGNVAEWNNDTIDCSGGYPCVNMPYDSTPGQEWIEFTAITTYGSFTYDFLRPSNNLWNANYGVGRLYTDVNNAAVGGNIHSFIRGGGMPYGANTGVFALGLDFEAAGASPLIGFRCSYTP